MTHQINTSYSNIRYDTELAKFCWFKTGGKAKVFFKPDNTEELSEYLQYNREKVYVIGAGSNLLVRDEGFDGTIIRLGRNFNYIEVEQENCILDVGAATLDVNVALVAAEHGIGGLEFLSGIPGTIGGAIAMNAGAYGTEVKDILLNVTAIHKSGQVKNFSSDELGFSYRTQSLGEDWIFTRARFKGYNDDIKNIKANMYEINMKRQGTQPISSKTSGSTFKNPTGYKAWELIEKSGCRGLSIGDAIVSTQHCNFFINRGNATAAEIERLIYTVKTKVLESTGLMLEEEIRIIGEHGPGNLTYSIQ